MVKDFKALLAARMNELTVDGEKLNGEKLAELLEVSPATISKWLSGKALPAQKHLPRIEAHLQVSRFQVLIAMGWLAPRTPEAALDEAQLLEQLKAKCTLPEAARAYEIVTDLGQSTDMKEHAMATLEGLRLLSFSKKGNNHATKASKKKPKEKNLPEGEQAGDEALNPREIRGRRRGGQSNGGAKKKSAGGRG